MYNTLGNVVWPKFTPVHMWLTCGYKVLLHILSRDPDAKVSMPSNPEVIFYCEVIGAKYPICDNV